MIAHSDNKFLTPTPVGNTGLIDERMALAGSSAHLDTIVLCGDGVPLYKIFNAIDQYLNCQFDTTRNYATAHGQKYHNNLHAQFGLLLSYNVTDFDNTVQYRLSIPGKICNATPFENLLQLLRLFKKWRCHATRFDWAMDDYDKVLSIDEYLKLCQNDCFYGARNFDYYSSRSKGGVDLGSTIYVGRAGGTQRLCIYDKNLESKGLINAIRMEYRFFDQKADYFLNMLLEVGEEKFITKKISRTCLGRIGFCESKLVTGKSLTLLKVWNEFVSVIGEKIKTTFPKIPTTIEDKKKWICSSVAPSLAMLATQMSYMKFMKWLSELISTAMKKLKPTQIGQLKYLKEWENFSRYGLDYWSIKDTFDLQSKSKKSPTESVKSVCVPLTSSTKTEKFLSVQRELTMMEQLSFLIAL